MLERPLCFKYLFFIHVLLFIFVLHDSGYTSDSETQTDSTNIKDQWFAPDKGRHLVASLMSTVLIQKLATSRFDTDPGKANLISVGFSFSIGFGKELMDSRSPQNHFSWKDLAVNLVGISVGLVLVGIE